MNEVLVGSLSMKEVRQVVHEYEQNSFEINVLKHYMVLAIDIATYIRINELNDKAEQNNQNYVRIFFSHMRGWFK